MRLSQSVKSKLFQRQEKLLPAGDYFNDSDLLNFYESIDGVDYIWSRDPKKLLTYRRIINQIYNEELGLDYGFYDLSEMDFRSFFFLALPKNDHAGGCRLTISNPSMQSSLPCEGDGFQIIDKFPEIDFENYKCAEISRFSLKRKYRSSRVSVGFYENFFRMSRDLLTAQNVRYIMICSSVSRQKIYFRYARKYFNLVLQKEFESPSDYNLDYFFCIYENPNFRK
jgi:hypothetical protein